MAETEPLRVALSEDEREALCPFRVGPNDEHPPHWWGNQGINTRCPGLPNVEVDTRSFVGTMVHLLPGVEPESVRRATLHALPDLGIRRLVAEAFTAADRDTALRERLAHVEALVAPQWRVIPPEVFDMPTADAFRAGRNSMIDQIRAVLDAAPHQQADAGLGATTEEQQHG